MICLTLILRVKGPLGTWTEQARLENVINNPKHTGVTTRPGPPRCALQPVHPPRPVMRPAARVKTCTAARRRACSKRSRPSSAPAALPERRFHGTTALPQASRLDCWSSLVPIRYACWCHYWKRQHCCLRYYQRCRLHCWLCRCWPCWRNCLARLRGLSDTRS